MPEILAEVEESIDITATVAATPGSLTDDYNDLQNHPSINGVELVGNKTTGDLGIEPLPGSITPEMFAPDTQEDMVVGLAKNLLANSGVTLSSPYLFRKSPNNVSAELHRLIGGTVAWNQQIITAEKSGSVTPSGTTYYSAKYLTGSAKIGHVYFMSAMFAYSGSGTDVNPFLQAGTSKRVTTTLSSTKKLVQMLQKVTGQTTLGLGITTGSGGRTLTSADAWSYDDAVAIDLTALFGSTMADAIATMESTTAGSGVAFFREIFPSAYMPYSAPTLASVQTSARVARGFNQWDEEWELGGIVNASGATYSATDRIRSKNFCRCIPGAEYYFKAPTAYLSVYWYDASGGYIGYEGASNQTKTVPTGACLFKLVLQSATAYTHDICVNISDTNRNGQYQPYTAKSYPIDDVVLRGIPKLTNGVLSYDGDIYLPNGEVTRRYAEVDLGSLTWTYYANAVFTATGLIGQAKEPSNATAVPNIVSRYLASSYLDIWTNEKDKTATIIFGTSGSHGQLWIRDSAYTDAATFKTAMNGVKLVYELATPTTEQADPYAEIQSAGETEQFVSESVVPVGNEAFYPEDLTGVVQNLAPLPTTAGTYKLQVTVSGGVPSYSWVAG